MRFVTAEHAHVRSCASVPSSYNRITGLVQFPDNLAIQCDTDLLYDWKYRIPFVRLGRGTSCIEPVSEMVIRDSDRVMSPHRLFLLRLAHPAFLKSSKSTEEKLAPGPVRLKFAAR